MGVTMTGLSVDAIEVLGQLFTNGPTWDGNIVSKSSRDELIKLGLVERLEGGWAFLTSEGVRVATEWDVDGGRYRSWYRKAKLHQ